MRTFAVDFVQAGREFQTHRHASDHGHPVRARCGPTCRLKHTDIVLDHNQLADPDIRRKVVRARDLPIGIGDMDASLYLLFKAIRQQSTVALSGESADEIFGGYRQFHDPVVQKT